MNTVRSTWLGWGVLCVAGGGSYYFAKRSINADKKMRFEADQKRKRLAERLEEEERQHKLAPPPDSTLSRNSPSGEASYDPAPIIHEDGVSTIPKQKSKFEPTEPYRTKKGDRFS